MYYFDTKIETCFDDLHNYRESTFKNGSCDLIDLFYDAQNKDLYIVNGHDNMVYPKSDNTLKLSHITNFYMMHDPGLKHARKNFTEHVIRSIKLADRRFKKGQFVNFSLQTWQLPKLTKKEIALLEGLE